MVRDRTLNVSSCQNLPFAQRETAWRQRAPKCGRVDQMDCCARRRL